MIKYDSHGRIICRVCEQYPLVGPCYCVINDSMECDDCHKTRCMEPKAVKLKNGETKIEQFGQTKL